MEKVSRRKRHSMERNRQTMRKLCLSAKFSHQEIRWNYGIFRSVNKTHDNIQHQQKQVNQIGATTMKQINKCKATCKPASNLFSLWMENFQESVSSWRKFMENLKMVVKCFMEKDFSIFIVTSFFLRIAVTIYLLAMWRTNKDFLYQEYYIQERNR